MCVCVCKRMSEGETVEVSVNVFMLSMFESVCRQDLGLQTDRGMMGPRRPKRDADEEPC